MTPLYLFPGSTTPDAVVIYAGGIRIATTDAGRRRYREWLAGVDRAAA